MFDLQKVTNQWTNDDLEECLLIHNLRKNTNLKHENELLISIWLNVLSNRYCAENKLDENHFSYNFLNINKKSLMEILKVKRHIIDIDIRYLEGAGLILVTRKNEMSFKLTDVGNNYIQAFTSTDEGKIMVAELIKKGEKYAKQ